MEELHSPGVNVQLATRGTKVLSHSEEWDNASSAHFPNVHMSFYWFNVGQQKIYYSLHFLYEVCLTLNTTARSNNLYKNS